MPVQALQCKECDATYPLDARYVCEQCFGPLDVDPAEPAPLDGLDARLSRLWTYGVDPRARGAPETWLRQARHRV